MLFEQAGVLWKLNITNPTDTASAAVDVEFELSAMVNKLAHVAWVQTLPYDPANFTYTELSRVSADVGLRGIVSLGKPALQTPALKPAVRFRKQQLLMRVCQPPLPAVLLPRVHHCNNLPLKADSGWRST